jgi:dUTP pyrophosphatase
MVNVKRLTAHAKLPAKATIGSAGYDLASAVDAVIPPGSRELISLGICIQVPRGTYGRIAPRSGLAVRNGIQVGAGVIDSDYTGEVKVLLFNHGTEPFAVTSGDRIAQLLIEKIVDDAEIKLVDEFVATDRGSGGFGSTGI